MKTRVSLAVFVALALGACASVPAPSQTAAVSTQTAAVAPISEEEVLAAQQAWGAALVQISSDYKAGGYEKAKATAGTVLDAAYGYNFGPVLFKPTLTQAPQTFRTTREGALSYFVGGDANFPNDTGFALKGWTGFETTNAAIFRRGDVAMSMGKVRLNNQDGSVTEVDKTWGYRKDENGTLRIVLHHSSLPFAVG
jgi:hypothetical protein